jgi:uncharacterized protein (UPF0332 family)
MAEKQELTQAYLTLAVEKLIVARELLAAAHFDDAISRAYYAMFYSAKAALLTVGSDPRSHSGVVAQFSQHFVKTGKIDRQYNRILSQAMQAREASDYDPVIRSSLSEAKQTIADAEDFLVKVKELLSALPSDEGS